MNEYWIVTENKTGRVICHCADINDAIMMVSFEPEKRTYSRHLLLMDQVIDVTSTTDKQLPGQIGLPAGKENLPSVELQQQVWLPERQQEPFIVN
jgi:hypothetical protein